LTPKNKTPVAACKQYNSNNLYIAFNFPSLFGPILAPNYCNAAFHKGETAMNISANLETAYAPGSHHILLVEDEPNVAKGLQLVLNDEGYGVETASTGGSALDMFRGNGFDLVVSDLRLPDIDGMEVIKNIKEQKPEVKIIIITGYPSVSSAVDAVRMGVMDYLRKPFTDEELIHSVQSAFKEIEKPSIENILAEGERKHLIQKNEVLRAIETAVRDERFSESLDRGGALDSYDLSDEAKAAVIAGDLDWIRTHVGQLSEPQLQWIYRRLEREIW
jgi:CheY-like chemotaxis protein